MWIVETDIHCGNVNKPFFSLRLIIYFNKIFNVEKNKLKKNEMSVLPRTFDHFYFIQNACVLCQKVLFLPTAYRIHQMITNDGEMSFKTEKCGKNA